MTSMTLNSIAADFSDSFTIVSKENLYFLSVGGGGTVGVFGTRSIHLSLSEPRLWPVHESDLLVVTDLTGFRRLANKSVMSTKESSESLSLLESFTTITSSIIFLL